MSQETKTGAGRSGRPARSTGWLARRTRLHEVARELSDAPSAGLASWARTTTGVVALLLALQMLTGTLLAFYFVPSADAAHASVAYVEKVAAGGAWLRALHYHGSQWLPLAILLHLLQMFLRGADARRPAAWLAWVMLLALVMASGATGYSLPWDARAFYSTRVGAGLAGGLPLAGDQARAWLAGGPDISTLTLSRLYALHLLVVPALMLATVAARLFIFRDNVVGSGDANGRDVAAPAASGDWAAAQLARNAVAVLVVFVVLSVVAVKFPAPLGPPAAEAEPGYLPRPGPQFLWLFQLLKYFTPAAASLVALLLPALVLCALASLPFLARSRREGRPTRIRRAVGLTTFTTLFVLVLGLSLAARLEDARDPRTREQLAKQARDEAEFRRAPFEPRATGAPRTSVARGQQPPAEASSSTQTAANVTPPPQPYATHCAKCHGARGEGRSINPPLVGVSARPDRTLQDIVRIIDDPRAYNLEKRMPSFAGKLSDEEKRAVAEWVVSLGGG